MCCTYIYTWGPPKLYETFWPVNATSPTDPDGALDGGDALHPVRVPPGLGGGDAAEAAAAATQGLSRRRRRGRGRHGGGRWGKRPPLRSHVVLFRGGRV